MVKHNHMVPNNKLHKDWQRYVKCHFDQPLAKKHRAVRRRQRAATKAPRPLGKLRPIVTCPTQKYNMRLRAGRGFTLLELRTAGIKGGCKYARTIGIAVDPRRRNKSQESMARNVRRLKQYMESLVLFPIRPTSAQRKDKEKMIKYYMAQQRAKQRLTQYQRYVKHPKPVQVTPVAVKEIVTVSRVPVYDVHATLKNEWCLGKHHFKWRRKNLRLAHKRKLDAAKKAKKAAKGK